MLVAGRWIQILGAFPWPWKLGPDLAMMAACKDMAKTAYKWTVRLFLLWIVFELVDWFKIMMILAGVVRHELSRTSNPSHLRVP